MLKLLQIYKRKEVQNRATILLVKFYKKLSCP